MLKPTRVAKLLNGDLGSNEQVLREMNPNTKLYLVESIEPIQNDKPRHLCCGIQVRELYYPVLRIGDTIWDVDHGLFIWTGKEWRFKEGM